MAHIAIITQLHPSTNPRCAKEANALVQAGHRVSYVTNLFAEGLEKMDADVLHPNVDLIPASDLRKGRCTPWRRTLIRLRRRIASDLIALLGIESTHALCHAPERLRIAAESLGADLYIGHIEGGIYAGLKLQRRGHRVAFDIEDWHSKDGTPSAQSRFPSRLVEKLENEALNRGVYVSTTSKPMAMALARAAECPEPKVILNVFPFGERGRARSMDSVADRSRPSLIWFSQNISPARGIGLVIDALSRIERPVELHLLGKVTPGYRQELQSRFTRCAHHCLVFHDPVPQHELAPMLMRFDIGLATEPTIPENKDLTISNKLFHYMQSGLAVVATGTSGQRFLAEQAPTSISVAEPGSPKSMAEALTPLVSDTQRLSEAKRASELHAKQRFCWEVESNKFLQLVESALSETPLPA